MPSVEFLTAEFAWMLLGAAVIGIVAQKLRMSYAVALVIAGLAVAVTRVAPAPKMEPAIVLFWFLPPLLFDASFRMDAREMARVARPVLLLAVPGTLVSAAVVGGVVAPTLGWTLPQGLLFGSLVSATDPVAVIAIVAALGLPRRLLLTLEGESLINDGMAITLYTVFLGATLYGQAGGRGPLEVFLVEVLGGVAIGLLLGATAARITRVIDDPLIEMLLSASLAYGSYLLADQVDSSGALACVAAGLVHGAYGRATGMSAQSSERLDHLWEFIGFLANAMLFLLIGFSVDLAGLGAEMGAVAVAVGAVLAARALVVEGAGAALRRAGWPTTRAERGLLTWAGLRGALTIALALGLPAAAPHREVMVTMAFGVVLFSLLAQGLTLPVAVRRLGLAHPGSAAAAGGR